MKNKFQTQHKDSSSSIGFIFWKVSNLHQKLQRDSLKHLNITPSQFSLLTCYFYLSENLEEPLSQSLACLQSGLDKMVVSDLTKALVSKNLLTKKKSKSDKRSYQLQLTEKGKKVCNESVKIIEQLDHDLFAKSGNSPMLLDMLRSILK